MPKTKLGGNSSLEMLWVNAGQVGANAGVSEGLEGQCGRMEGEKKRNASSAEMKVRKGKQERRPCAHKRRLLTTTIAPTYRSSNDDCEMHTQLVGVRDCSWDFKIFTGSRH